MVDVVDKQTRSRMMAGIRGKDTRPEIRLRKALHAMGFRFRLHDKRLPGRPDIVLPKWKAAIEVHGCFWHRHEGCRYASTPATRPEFWEKKFAANVARDRRNLEKLHEAGWRTAVIWECWLREKDINELVSSLGSWTRSDRQKFDFQHDDGRYLPNSVLPLLEQAPSKRSMKKGRNLLALRHDDMKEAVVRLLKNRLKAGGRGSIKRSVLQRELTKSEAVDPVLGNARDSVETNLNKAIAALRREQPPRLDKDRGDEMVRLVRKK